MPSRYREVLSLIGDTVIEELTERNLDREQALSVSRGVIRFSANAIRAVHRGEFDNLIHPRALVVTGGLEVHHAVEAFWAIRPTGASLSAGSRSRFPAGNAASYCRLLPPAPLRGWR